MSKLNVDQKTIKDLFQNKHADFLIPDYQRPYAWEEKECETLWEDIFEFAFPENDHTKFDNNNEYFLGPIVTFKNNDEKMEVIDGQQRLTTLMLLLRAFYDRFANMQDENSRSTRENIEKCIWKTDEFGKPDRSKLKIDSEVATDRDKEEFLEILRTGYVHKDQQSNYALNYRFFQERIDKFIKDFSGYLPYLPTRILNNCIILPIEAESQDTALRIFSTLNDRGKPLSDADIFKAQLYKFYTNSGKKDDFMQRWKELDELCEKIFQPPYGTPMDELFTRYMHYARAKMGNKSTTTEAVRKFYENDGYALLKKEETFDNLIELAHFWEAVSNQDENRFSQRALRKLFVLNYAPNGMWTYLVSVYFMQNKNSDGGLEDDVFFSFLNKIIAFIWAYTITNPGVSALRTPVYAEMVKIVTNHPVTFDGYHFNTEYVKNAFSNFTFNNRKTITKSMLTWWAFQYEKQELCSLKTVFEIEHIYPCNRYIKETSLTDKSNLESLGNKSLLEKRINIRASDYHFDDKKKYYLGFKTSRGQQKSGTKIQELISLAKNASDFNEGNILERNDTIVSAFINYLQKNDLTVN